MQKHCLVLKQHHSYPVEKHVNYAFLKNDRNMVKIGSLTVEDTSNLLSALLKSVEFGTATAPSSLVVLSSAEELTFAEINLENVSNIALTKTLL